VKELLEDTLDPELKDLTYRKYKAKYKKLLVYGKLLEAERTSKDQGHWP